MLSLRDVNDLVALYSPQATADVTLASLYAGLLMATAGMQTSQALALSVPGILPQQEARSNVSIPLRQSSCMLVIIS